MTRTLTLVGRVRAEPLELLLLQHAQQLDLHVGDSSPTSSRKIVPLCASSKRPFFCCTAPVNAPRSCPNSSLSARLAGSAAQLTLTITPCRRRLRLWMARAVSSLPVPVSPSTSTVDSVSATMPIDLNTLLHRRRFTDDLAVAALDVDLLAQVDVLRFELLGAFAIGHVASDERHGGMAVHQHAEQSGASLEPALPGQDPQRVLERLAGARLERLLHETQMRVGNRCRQDVVKALALHLLGRAIQQILARRQDLDVAALVIDDEHQIRKRVEDRRQPVLAALEIGRARHHAILELDGVALDALAQLRLTDRHGERAGHLLRDLDGLPDRRSAPRPTSR